MPKEDVDGIMRDAKKTISVTLPDNNETVKLAKLKYAQMKSVFRETDTWKRNDVSLISSLENAGNPKGLDWLDNLTTDDVSALSNAFASLTGPQITLETWLGDKHPDLLEAYRKESQPSGVVAPRRGTTNPLSGSSTKVTVSPSFG